jgi:VCBS repeat-containing protein|tara:strand:+ start:105 stop:533 length:429 start_codon:yes stop_codon:yes gene_type:complete
MAITSTLTTSFKVELLKGNHNFTNSSGDTMKLALYTSSATLGATTTSFVTTGQASGTGYSTGGGTLTNVTPTSTGTTAVTDFSDLTFGTATITARGCMIYNSSDSNKSVATIDFGGDKTSTAGDFTIVFPAKAASTAIIRIA